jgi:hypothetical protein
MVERVRVGSQTRFNAPKLCVNMLHGNAPFRAIIYLTNRGNFMDAGTVIIAVATVITGAATCVSAFVMWDQWRGRISAEWEWYWSGDAAKRTLELTATIVNETSSTLQAGVVTIDRVPVSSVSAGNPPREKHESWPANQAPLTTDVGPHKRQGFRIVIQLDWAALSSLPVKRRFRRSRSDTLLRSQITVVSRSARRWRRTFTAQIEIPRQMIDAAKTA